MASEDPEATVFIVTYQGGRRALEAVQSVLDQGYPKEKYEVVVVDDGSTDGTGDLLEDLSIRLMRHERNRGIGAAKSTALAHSRGKYVCIIDDDCVADRGWLEELMKAYDRYPDASGVGGRIEAFDPRSLFEFYAQFSKNPVYSHVPEMEPGRRIRGYLRKSLFGAPPLEDGQEIASIMGNNCSYLRALMEAAGGFDPALKRGVDFDLNLKLRRMGATFRYADRAIVKHRHRATFRTFFSHIFTYGKAYVRMAGRHPGLRVIPYPLPAIALLLVPLALLTGLWYLPLLIPLFYVIKDLPYNVRIARARGVLSAPLSFPIIDFLREFVYDLAIVVGLLSRK